jgi:hypothetical protein
VHNKIEVDEVAEEALSPVEGDKGQAGVEQVIVE